MSQRHALEDQIIKVLPQKIASFEQRIEGYTADMNRLKENTHPNADGFSPMEVEGTVHTDKKAAGSAILAACKAMTSPDPVPLGQYRGFAMELSFESFSKEYRITLKGVLHHTTGLGTDIFGNILRLDNLLGGMEEGLIACREQLENANVLQLDNAKVEVEKPFPQEDELKKNPPVWMNSISCSIWISGTARSWMGDRMKMSFPSAVTIPTGNGESKREQAARLPPYIRCCIIAANGRPSEAFPLTPRSCP